MATACNLNVKPLGGPQQTISNADHGAAESAVDAMDRLSTDPQPDTEIHLSLTPARVATADDSTRADLLLLRIRTALRKYVDVRFAAADGFEELPATEGSHTIHHLLNWASASEEARRFDPAKPTSLLYRERTDGTLALVGAMYTAPARFSVGQLDQRIPVGLARWHRHVNWCAPGSGSGAQWLATQDGSPVYGPESPIATREACEAAGGVFYPGIFGWMVHVTFVGSDDPAVVWSGYVSPTATDSASAHDSSAPERPQAVTLALRPVALPPRPAPSAPPKSLVRQNPHGAPAPPAILTASAQHPVSTPGLPAVPPTPQRPDQRPPAVLAAGGHVTNSFVSGSRAIAYDRFTPSGPGEHPVILLLHADAGLPPQADRFQEFAAALQQRGYLVEVVHYFDRTGTIVADPAQRMAHFREWVGTVRDAVGDAGRALGADSTRVGLFGTGLGGTLALAVGAQDGRVRTVVEYGGTMPAWAVPTVRRMPPVFIGQNNADKPAAVREAYRVRAVCQAVNAPFELDLFNATGQGGRAAGVDLRQRTLAFYEKYLRGPQ